MSDHSIREAGTVTLLQQITEDVKVHEHFTWKNEYIRCVEENPHITIYQIQVAEHVVHITVDRFSITAVIPVPFPSGYKL
jgi:hypothetical protein